MGLLTEEEKARRFGRFWEMKEATRAEVNASLERAAMRNPTFAAALAAMTPEAHAAGEAQVREAERAALVEGRWDDYLENVRLQGWLYAQMGIAFADWFELLGAYRSVVLKRTLADERAADLEWVADVLLGMDRFIDIGMSVLGRSYIDSKESILRRAEAQIAIYSDMFRGAPMGLVLYHWDDRADPGSLRIVDINPQAMVLSPHIHQGMIGKTIREALPHLLEEKTVLSNFIETLEMGGPRDWVATVPILGRERTYRMRCFTPKDRVLGVMFEEITEQRRLEQQVRANVAELERSNRDLDQFAYVASHDLKAPLQDIRNLASWIGEDLGEQVPTPTVRHLRLLRERAERMEKLLDDLLDYSRAGRVQGACDDVFLAEVVAEALALVPVPEGFRVSAEVPNLPLQTPRGALAQVLRNLVGNALKHHDGPPGKVTVSVEEAGDLLRISVADDGPGIPPEHHDRVFQMFQTLRPRDEVEGSGMGLAIVKKLVQSQGGTIGVESLERGTVIRFTWPRRSREKERDER
jgi:signal transduction histidine kinase